MKPIMEIRGIRNHNPGNIRHNAKWEGLAEVQTDSAFCTFASPEFGIRAMAKILLNYKRRHGLVTVRGIINRWAPPNENDTEAYIKHAAFMLNVLSDEAVDVENPKTMFRLISVIIEHENGVNPYSREIVRRGIDMALEG